MFEIVSLIINHLLQVVVENLQFSGLERKIYDSVFMDAKRKFQQLDEKGLVSRNYTHILAMLMRLVMYHPILNSD